MEDTRKRLLRYLNDSYASEVGGLLSLKDLALMAIDQPDLRAAIEEHIHITETQAERLRNRILILGGDKSEPKAIVNSIIAKGSSLVNVFHDKEDKLTQDLIKAYAFEHFEIGAYTSLRAYSEAIGDYETSFLAAQILSEERMAAETLEKFIPNCAVQAVNKSTAYTPGKEGGKIGALSGGLLNIPPAAWLVPGAVLAVWGVSKWLGGRSDTSGSNGGNSFRTATVSTMTDDDMLLEPVGSEVATVYTSESTYVPSSIPSTSSTIPSVFDNTPSSGLSSGSSSTLSSGSAFGSSTTTNVD